MWKLDNSANSSHTIQTDGYFRFPRPAKSLEFTGERLTSAVEGQIEFEHYHRYCLARDLCAGRDVLDVASGEGYGTAILAGVARSITGVDIDPVAVRHADASYAHANLRFLQGDVLALPLDEASVDAVVSFETLEHVTNHSGFLNEVKRVLRPSGLFIVSTPDRAVYSAPGTDPNPHHLLELSEPEFRALLLENFANVHILPQRAVLGSLLAAEESPRWRSYERRGPDIIEATKGLARAQYLIAVASDAVLPDTPSSVYLDRRRVHDVIEQSLRLPAMEAQLRHLINERDSYRAEAARLDGELRTSQQQLDESNGQRRTLEEQLGESNWQRRTLEREEQLGESKGQRRTLEEQLGESMEQLPDWRSNCVLWRRVARLEGGDRRVAGATECDGAKIWGHIQLAPEIDQIIVLSSGAQDTQREALKDSL